MGKITTKTIRKKKEDGEKIAMITSYDYPFARLADESGVDMILVGDSLGNTVLGYDTTVKVTMDDMVHHTQAVTRAVKNALVVADMPFLSYHIGEQEALQNAGRLMQADADCVKLEGGQEVCGVVRRMVQAGIPVMGHLGLTPQSVNVFGGFYVQGRTETQREKLLADAKALVEAGVFSIVLECVPEDLAAEVTAAVPVPTIGIGAGPKCDGQVLVIHDLLGLSGDFRPKFVKQYCNVSEIIKNAVTAYTQEVKGGVFPDKEHSFQ